MEWIQKYNEFGQSVDSIKICFIVSRPCPDFEPTITPCFPVVAIVSNCG